MDLTTTERVQTLLNSGGASLTGLDALISQVITDVSGRVEEHLGRAALVAERTEVFDVETPMRGVLLEAFPVLDAPAPIVKYSRDRAFGSAEAMDTEWYAVDLQRGIIRFDGWWPIGCSPRTLQIVYTGGMAADTAAFIAAWPMVAHAVDLQVSHLIQRRRGLGATGESVGAGSISVIGAYDLLPEVSNIIGLYRRRMV